MQAIDTSAAVQPPGSRPAMWSAPGSLSAPASRAVSLGVRRAEALIAAHPETPFTVEGLARAVGLSTRSLSRGFQRLRGYGPMTAVRRSRLERVRLDLLTAGPCENVTSAAMRWGFYHLGRFSGLYASHFGELPSATKSAAARQGSSWQAEPRRRPHGNLPSLASQP